MSSLAATSVPVAAAKDRRWDAGRWFVFAAVAASAFVIVLGPISDGDIYWHLAAGREILHRRELLRVDPFTLSAAGRPWIDVHWLFQLGAYATYLAFGFLGLALAKSTLVAVGAVLLARTAERAGGAIARATCAVALTGGLLLSRHLLPTRPVLVTLACLAIFLSVLEPLRTAKARPSRAWLALPFVQVIWGNCQGLAPLGPALVSMYLAGAWLSSRGFRRWPFESTASFSIRPLALALVLCLLAGLASPYGLDAALLPLRLLRRITPGQANIFSSAVAENIPPLLLERSAPELIGHFKWVLVGLAAAIAIVRPRLHVTHVFVLVTFVSLALMANRNVPILYWLTAPVAAVALSPGMRRIYETPRAAWFHLSLRRSCAAVGVVVLLGAEFGLAVLVQTREPAPGVPAPFHFPIESARQLGERGVAGPVFAADQHGGYLTFTVPALRPYIDTRLVLHSGQEYADYLSLFDDPSRFDALDVRERFNAVVLTTAYPDRYLSLIWHLAGSPDWRLVSTDGAEVLFLRQGMALALDERATIDAILQQLAVRFGGGATALHEAARLHLARLLVVLGQSQQAEYVLTSLDSRPAAELRARAQFVTGERRAAESLAYILLEQDPRDIRSLALLAEIAVADGQPDKAKEFLRRALAIDPYDAEATSVVDRLERR